MKELPAKENDSQGQKDRSCDHYLDASRDLCPMSFVRAKLLLEQIAPGETACIRVNVGEAMTNVPRAIQELGHEILGITAETAPDAAPGFYIRVLRI